MPTRYKVDLNSVIFNKAKRKEVLRRGTANIAKGFRQETKQAMVDSPRGGRLYKRGSTVGAQIFHRASARGEKPAPDTLNLVNSVVDAPGVSNEFSAQHDVFVDDTRAPYGKYLERPRLDRPIMSTEDVGKYKNSDKMRAEVLKMARELSE